MGRKTYKKKTNAKKHAHGRSVYKVKHGWRLTKKKSKSHSRRRRRSWP